MKIQYDKSIEDQAKDLVADEIEEFANKFRSVYKELHADRETGC